MGCASANHENFIIPEILSGPLQRGRRFKLSSEDAYEGFGVCIHTAVVLIPQDSQGVAREHLLHSDMTAEDFNDGALDAPAMRKLIYIIYGVLKNRRRFDLDYGKEFAFTLDDQDDIYSLDNDRQIYAWVNLEKCIIDPFRFVSDTIDGANKN